MATTGSARTPRAVPDRAEPAGGPTAPAAPAPSGPPGRAPAGPAARLRFGYASGSLVTGTFTTLPGLLLLPYLTDTLGVGAALAGVIVFVPKAWDALLNPWSGGPATAPAPAGAPAARTSWAVASRWPWPSR